MTTSVEALPVHWREERLRYNVLRTVYERAGADCGVHITGAAIGTALSLEYEELFRVTRFLESRGFLYHQGEGPRVCITPKGVAYMEILAGRRQSIRG